MIERNNFRNVPAIACLLMLVCSVRSWSQIEDVEVQIINPLKVTLPVMERNFDKVQIRPPEPVYPPLIYEVAPLIYSAPPFKPGIRPLKVRLPENPVPSRGYVSLGFGNYTSPFAEGFFPILQGGKGSASSGVRFFHNSYLKGPVDGRNSASGQTSVSVDFRSPGKKFLSEGLLNYRNTYSGFYGYTPGTEVTRKEIAHGYNQFSASYTLQHTGKSPVGFRFTPSLSYLWDNLSAMEVDAQARFEADHKLGKKGKMEWNGAYDLLARQDESVEPKPRHLVSAASVYSRSLTDNIDLKAGARVDFENDTLLSGTVHIYPEVNLQWKANRRIQASFALTGGVDKVSVHRMSAENLWLDKNITISHSNRLVDAEARVQAGLGSGLSVTAGANYTSYSNLYFYVNSSVSGLSGDQSRFSPVYDDARRTDLFGMLSLNKGASTLNLRADYFAWSVSELVAPFHRPEWQVDLSGDFKLFGRLLARPSLMMLGGIKALKDNGTEVVTLPSATDLGMRLDYNFSERGSIFMRFNNILNNSYQLLQNYPVRGFQGMAGLTWKF